MFNIEADQLIQSLWEGLRPEKPDFRRSPLDTLAVVSEGIVVTLDLRLHHYALSTDEYHRSALVHTVLTGNTSVFQAVSRDFKKWDQIHLDDWFNYSNHDSCWRTDGMRGFQQLFFELTAEMNEEIVADGHSALRPIDFGQFCTLGALAAKPWERVEVAHGRVAGEHHRRQIVGLQRKEG